MSDTERLQGTRRRKLFVGPRCRVTGSSRLLRRPFGPYVPLSVMTGWEILGAVILLFLPSRMACLFSLSPASTYCPREALSWFAKARGRSMVESSRPAAAGCFEFLRFFRVISFIVSAAHFLFNLMSSSTGGNGQKGRRRSLRSFHSTFRLCFDRCCYFWTVRETKGGLRGLFCLTFRCHYTSNSQESLYQGLQVSGSSTWSFLCFTERNGCPKVVSVP